MAENLGSVYYTVDAETTSLLKAEAQVNKSIGAMVSRFEAADNATQSFIMTQESLGRTINAAGQVFDKHGKIVVDATKKYRQLAAESNTLRETLLKQTKVSNSVNHALAAQSRSFGQAGIQIQQFFGQVQTGTNFLVAFSQQSADLGFVLGMPLAGAIAGLTASLVSFLIPSIVESGQAMDNLKDAVSAADDVMETSQAGVTSLSDKVRELAQVSETAAKASLVSAWLATREHP